MNKDEESLRRLLDLDGETFIFDDGFFTKIEVQRVEPSDGRPHGLKYSLTLHDKTKARVFGIDNGHGLTVEKVSGRKKTPGKYVATKRVYDHKHVSENDPGQVYEFSDAGQLVEDFFREVDDILKRRREQR